MKILLNFFIIINYIKIYLSLKIKYILKKNKKQKIFIVIFIIYIIILK